MHRRDALIAPAALSFASCAARPRPVGMTTPALTASSLNLDRNSLSPDPLYARRGIDGPHGGTMLTAHPHRLLRIEPSSEAAARWAADLDAARAAASVDLPANGEGRLDLVVDFGTELDAELELVVRTVRPRVTMFVTFGESRAEAESWGVPSTTPVAVVRFDADEPGVHRRRFDARGFRCIRLLAHDVGAALRFESLSAQAWLAFRERRGDLAVADARLQRAWQASAYTARLCTRPDGYWDGPKRDRIGWYGDARITQTTTDLTFFDPAAAERMLARLDPERWANGIPGYSFDALAMLRQLVTAHGATAGAREAWRPARELLTWIQRTQVDSEGLLVRRDETQYFFGYAFFDWTPQPVGGRFEELLPLQAKLLAGLDDAAWVASRLGDATRADGIARWAARLRPLLTSRFFVPGTGFVHTLNRSEVGLREPAANRDYHGTYVEGRRLGPSGATRHSAALAAMAGLAATEQARRSVLSTLDDASLQPVLTPYFAYYEQSARGACGDGAGAVVRMRDYVAAILDAGDGPTVWESYDPSKSGVRRWGLNAFPKSLCHGWSSGLVELTTRHLAGVRAVEPGFGAVALQPALELRTPFEATIPTPHGSLQVRRARPDGDVTYVLPRAIAVASAAQSGVRIGRR